MTNIRGARAMGALAAFLAPLLAAGAVSAHHSFAMFDAEKQVTVAGVVKQFTWANPHVWLDVMVTNDRGDAQQWGLESLAVGLLYRDGWTADSLKPGDRVTVQLHPMRDGSVGGQLMKVTFPDGRVLNSGNARP
jgi:uncharacterized protein DUF6152